MKEAFDSNWISPAGPHISAFESELGSYLSNRHVSVVSSGTAAIHLALVILGIGREDEVLCSTFTFSGSCNPICYLGATPVFVDSEPESWNMDPALLRVAIAERIRAKGRAPKAIIVVHLYGMPARMDEIRSISDEFKIPIIEDAAEALGARYRGQACGTFGHFGILSFNGNKIITTSGGGALVSADEKWIERAGFLATQARDPAPHYQHSEIGYNYRLSNVSAGIGRGQLKVLDKRVMRRREIFDTYVQELGNKRGVTFQPEAEGSYSNRWLSCILLDPAVVSPDVLHVALQRENIECRPLWKPMHLQPVFSKAPYFGSGVSEGFFKTGLCLPSGSGMTEADQARVVDAILSEL